MIGPRRTQPNLNRARTVCHPIPAAIAESSVMLWKVPVARRVLTAGTQKRRKHQERRIGPGLPNGEAQDNVSRALPSEPRSAR